jgi:hypothetical protein
VLLTVSVNTTIALFKSIGVVGQFDMNQLMAALMQIQTFGGGIGADQNQSVFISKALNALASHLIGVVTFDG